MFADRLYIITLFLHFTFVVAMGDANKPFEIRRVALGLR
jgi:hypothetical protein